MPEKTYSDREIDRFMDTFANQLEEARADLSKEIKDYAERDKSAHEEFGKILLRTEGKVDVTNGKVAAIKKWQERINGGMIASGAFLVFVVLPLAGWVLYMQANFRLATQKEIQQAVNQAFDDRVQKVTQ